MSVLKLSLGATEHCVANWEWESLCGKCKSSRRILRDSAIIY